MGNTKTPYMAQRIIPIIDQIYFSFKKCGVSIGNIIFSKPMVVLWCDKFDYGIRGYNGRGISW